MTTFCYFIPGTSIKHGPYSPVRMTRWYRDAYFGLDQVFIEYYRGKEMERYTLQYLHDLYGVFDPFRSEREISVFPLLEGVPLDCHETVVGSVQSLWDHLDPLRRMFSAVSQVSGISEYSRDSFYDLQADGCPICLVPFWNPDALVQHCLSPEHLATLTALGRGVYLDDFAWMGSLFSWFKTVSWSEQERKAPGRVLASVENLDEKRPRIMDDGLWTGNHDNDRSTQHPKLPILHGSLSEDKNDRLGGILMEESLDKLIKLFRKVDRSKVLMLPELQQLSPNKLSKCHWCGKSLDNPYNSISHMLSRAHFAQVKQRGGLSRDDFRFWMTRLSSCVARSLSQRS